MNLFKNRQRIISVILSFTLVCGLLAGIPLICPTTARAETAESSEMLVGAGIGDITGPITEISTGYNSLGDVMEGILMRLYARAFIVEANGKSVVYVSAEMVHMTESIKPGVLKELNKRGLGGKYTEQNVMLAATHCHSAPSNVSWYPLYDLVNGVPGYDDVYYKIVVQGIADAIQKADESLRPGTIKIAEGDIENAVFNRSIEAYKWNNDADEYADDLNNEMVLLRFEGTDGTEIGSLNWFGSHGTSNSIDNTLVSADHKGYAAYEFEQEKGGGFVAAFAQSESGDSSPNQPQADVTADFQRPSDLDPALSVIENEIVHGTKELSKAVELYNSANTALSGTVGYRYTNVDFSSIKVDADYIGNDRMPYDDVSEASTGVPCIGAGIMAGDEEGAPVDYASEGEVKNTYSQDENGNWVKHEFEFTSLQLKGLQYILGPLWPTAQKVLGAEQYEEEQMEKVVCLPVGDLMQTIQPLQVFTIGELAIVGIPFECTAMQARRIRAVLENTLAPAGVKKVVLSTLTNSYSQYVTTREEYAAQNYEGSTVLFGPWSGAALTQELDRICRDLVNGEPSEEGAAAPDLSGKVLVKTPAAISVIKDSGSFGKIITNVKSGYHVGDTASVVLQGANPRNISVLRLSGGLSKYYDPDTYTYMEVQKKNSDGSWITVRSDSDPYTTFEWQRTGGSLSTYSQVTLSWLLKNAEPGTYRFKYNGLARNLFGKYSKFVCVSGEFVVVS